MIDNKYSHWPSPEINDVKNNNFTLHTDKEYLTIENKKINYYHHKILWKKDGQDLPNDVRISLR
jgi:hypothetical protein